MTKSERVVPKGTFRRRWKRRHPIALDRAPGVLARLRFLTEIAQHRVDAALQRNIARTDRLLHSSPFSIRAQSLELFVRIKHKRRPGKPPRHARAIRMQPYDVKSLSRKTEREMRIIRVLADVGIP